jgi:DNA-binding LacI/PurR family transcriptional regulator
MSNSLDDAPKYVQIKRALMEEIHKGNYLPGHSFVTEREVCHTFGVSRITAVRAINDLVLEGVLVRKRGVGTFVAGSAGPPRQDGTGVLIAGIFREIRGHHVLEIVAGIEKACAESGASLLLFDSASRAEHEVANFHKARDAGAQGLIVYPVAGHANAAAFQAPGPLVAVDRYHPSAPTDAVLPDSFQAARLVTGHLLEAGHRSIALLWGELECTSVRDHEVGFRRAMMDYGLEIDAETTALRSYAARSERSRHALLRSWLASPGPPTAFIAANSHTLQVLRSDLLALGIDVDAVALGAFGNDNPPALEAMGAVGAALPSAAMGAAATQLLLDRIANRREGPPVHRTLPVHLTGAVVPV